MCVSVSVSKRDTKIERKSKKANAEDVKEVIKQGVAINIVQVSGCTIFIAPLVSWGMLWEANAAHTNIHMVRSTLPFIDNGATVQD